MRIFGISRVIILRIEVEFEGRFIKLLILRKDEGGSLLNCWLTRAMAFWNSSSSSYSKSDLFDCRGLSYVGD